MEAAIDFLPRVNEANRHIVENDIGRKLIDIEPERALSFGLTIQTKRKERYYETILNSWANADGAAHFTNLQLIPSEFRDLASMEIPQVIRRLMFLSDNEINELDALILAEDSRFSKRLVIQD